KYLNESESVKIQASQASRQHSEFITQLCHFFDMDLRGKEEPQEHLLSKISGMHEEIATLKEQIATFKETANVHEMELKANRETIMRLVSELSKEQKKTATYSQDMEKLSEVCEAVAVLNRCLAEVMGWMRASKLKLNPDKTEVLLVSGSNSWVGDLGLVLDGVALPLKDRVRSLGVLLDLELSLEAQVLRCQYGPELNSSTADKQNLEKEIRKLQDRLAACQSAWETSQKELSHLKECCNENEEYLKSSTEEARAAKSLHRTFKEQIATLLGSNSILVSPSEEDIIEKIREMCHDEESKKTVVSQLEARIAKLAEMQETQNKLHQETLQKTRKAESKSETLHNQLMRLEGELVSGDVIRDSLKLEKQNYLQFLDQLSEKLNLDCVAADIGFDMRLEAILARVEQLIKLEGDTLRENKIMAHNLQRKLKTQKEQLDNKVLQMKLLRQKIVQLEEEKQVRTALAVERDEANLTLRKLQKKVDRLQNELALAREANTDLKVKLADANELKIRTLEQDKTIEELSKSQEKLEKMKTKAEKQLSSAKSELQLKEREAKEDKEKARNMLESVSSELATFKSALDEVMKKERQLADFREVVSQMLGLNTAAVALPDYEIITRLERLIHSHQHHFVPCICFKDMPVRQDGPLQLLH
ncbi:hypothetical protein EYD10_00454, partial [Varanus komodoensis]